MCWEQKHQVFHFKRLSWTLMQLSCKEANEQSCDGLHSSVS